MEKNMVKRANETYATLYLFVNLLFALLFVFVWQFRCSSLISPSFAHTVCTFRINNSRVNSFRAGLVCLSAFYICIAIFILHTQFFFIHSFDANSFFHSSCFSNLLMFEYMYTSNDLLTVYAPSQQFVELRLKSV